MTIKEFENAALNETIEYFKLRDIELEPNDLTLVYSSEFFGNLSCGITVDEDKPYFINCSYDPRKGLISLNVYISIDTHEMPECLVCIDEPGHKEDEEYLDDEEEDEEEYLDDEEDLED